MKAGQPLEDGENTSWSAALGSVRRVPRNIALTCVRLTNSSRPSLNEVVISSMPRSYLESVWRVKSRISLKSPFTSKKKLRTPPRPLPFPCAALASAPPFSRCLCTAARMMCSSRVESLPPLKLKATPLSPYSSMVLSTTSTAEWNLPTSTSSPVASTAAMISAIEPPSPPAVPLHLQPSFRSRHFSRSRLRATPQRNGQWMRGYNSCASFPPPPTLQQRRR
mmetsp:Transcript_54404/g.172864  ORF Transcript_54404/g.172864 Transcript_54404/m.172864 type:complete len:222 (+) Transcript_54404:966-1631(+)